MWAINTICSDECWNWFHCNYNVVRYHVIFLERVIVYWLYSYASLFYVFVGLCVSMIRCVWHTASLKMMKYSNWINCILSCIFCSSVITVRYWSFVYYLFHDFLIIIMCILDLFKYTLSSMQLCHYVTEKTPYQERGIKRINANTNNFEYW